MQICLLSVGFMATSDIEPLNYERVRGYLGHYPAGTSLKSVLYFYHLIKHGKFIEFDYGFEEN